ncbi:MAG: transposase, partial [Bacteroidota bacterium]|nr:transposase [Bacteroidota bacterium]
MAYDPEKHHRRNIRLKGYDYTQPGAYFIAICTHGRECLFGEIIDGEMHLNEAGQIVVQTWQDLPNHGPSVQLDAFVVMPNHVHGIIIIT